MDTLTFISYVLKDVAWPVTIFGILLMFQSNLKSLLGRISKLKIKDAELELEKIADAAEATREVHEQNSPYLDTPEAMKTRAIFEISPQAAVVAAWVDFEAAARQAAGETVSETPEGRRPLTMRTLFNKLRKDGFVDDQDVKFLETIQIVRNAALHQPELDLGEELASKVMRVLLVLTWEIRHGEKRAKQGSMGTVEEGQP